MPAAGAMPMHHQSLVRYQLQKGRNEKFRPFLLYISSQAVAGRLACLIVTRPFVKTKVTPPPE